MSKDKIYLTVIVLLAITLIVGCALQTQRVKRLSVSEIIIPKEGLIFKTEDGKSALCGLLKMVGYCPFSCLGVRPLTKC